MSRPEKDETRRTAADDAGKEMIRPTTDDAGKEMIRPTAGDAGRLVIRRMTTGDIDRVLVVERACFSHPWSAEVFSATLLLPYAHYYVAEITEEDGTQRIIGECGVRDIVGEGEITNVAVHPDWQGFGIASRMLGDVLARSLEEGMTAFTLEVRAGNRPAIALYKKYGFHTEGIRADFYDKPVEDALIMWRRKI